MERSRIAPLEYTHTHALVLISAVFPRTICLIRNRVCCYCLCTNDSVVSALLVKGLSVNLKLSRYFTISQVYGTKFVLVHSDLIVRKVSCLEEINQSVCHGEWKNLKILWLRFFCMLMMGWVVDQECRCNLPRVPRASLHHARTRSHSRH